MEVRWSMFSVDSDSDFSHGMCGLGAPPLRDEPGGRLYSTPLSTERAYVVLRIFKLDDFKQRRLVTHGQARTFYAVVFLGGIDVEDKPGLVHNTFGLLVSNIPPMFALCGLHAITLAANLPTLSTLAKSFASTLTVAQWPSPSVFILVLG